MIENAFSMPMLLDNFPIEQKHVDLLKGIAQEKFQSHGLELGDAHSTATNIRDFHNLEEIKHLCDHVTECADKLWQAYGLTKRFKPYIKETWINRHGKGGYTDLHYHSGSPISAAYYLEYEPGNGDIKFVNPLEYHQCHEPREDSEDITIEIEKFDLVMFPGILKHSTEVNTLESERYVLTFNFDYKNREPVRHIF